LGEREQSFFSAVALLGREQVALGKQALRRSSHPEVRRLAQQTINAFIRMGGQLITLAEAKGVVLPTELDAAQRAEMDALAATDAGAFDALYLTMQQRGQNQLTTLFVGQAQGPGDRQLTTWAQNALPQLEAHGRRLAATQRAAQAAQGVQTAEDAP
jgi:putative membrane protein